tara:strand:- start:393 stop:605 length:213 start_codon:yes stop_codon:yes gene_type:complete
MMMENVNQNIGVFLAAVGQSVPIVAECLSVMGRQDFTANHVSIPSMIMEIVKMTHATFATLIHAIRVIQR